MYSSHLLKSDFAWNDCNILAPIGAIFQKVFSQILAITIADCHPIKKLGFSWWQFFSVVDSCGLYDLFWND